MPHHNIVSLLYAIQGMAESHLERVKEGDLRRVEERLSHAEKVLQRNSTQARLALEITKRLGLLLRKEGKRGRRRFRASLEGAWETVRSLLRKEFRGFPFEFVERIPPRFFPVRIRQKELEEILYVISSNALQAAEARGNARNGVRPKLAIRAQLGFSTKEEPLAWITLSDTGPGIPAKALPRLFDPFFTTKDQGDGNGLGLYLVRELVTKNGGQISVASFEGSGTTFTLELPVA